MATNGAGGLDTGSIGASTWYYVYAIYNPITATASILATTSGSGAKIYGGSNMPSGYTASCLLGQFRSNSSSQVTAFNQQNNSVSVPFVQLVNGGSASSYTATASSVLTPPNCKSVSGWAGQGNNTAGASLNIATDVNGTGIFAIENTGTSTGIYVPYTILTTQTIPGTFYYYVAGGGQAVINGSGYTF